MIPKTSKGSNYKVSVTGSSHKWCVGCAAAAAFCPSNAPPARGRGRFSLAREAKRLTKGDRGEGKGAIKGGFYKKRRQGSRQCELKRKR